MNGYAVAGIFAGSLTGSGAGVGAGNSRSGASSGLIGSVFMGTGADLRNGSGRYSGKGSISNSLWGAPIFVIFVIHFLTYVSGKFSIVNTYSLTRERRISSAVIV